MSMTADFTLLAVNFKHGNSYSVLMCKCKKKRSNGNLKEHLQAHQGLHGAQDNPKKKDINVQNTQIYMEPLWCVLLSVGANSYLETRATCSAISRGTIYSLKFRKRKSDRSNCIHAHPQISWQWIRWMEHICLPSLSPSPTHPLPHRASVSWSSLDSSWSFGSLGDERNDEIRNIWNVTGA